MTVNIDGGKVIEALRRQRNQAQDEAALLQVRLADVEQALNTAEQLIAQLKQKAEIPSVEQTALDGQ